MKTTRDRYLFFFLLAVVIISLNCSLLHAQMAPPPTRSLPPGGHGTSSAPGYPDSLGGSLLYESIQNVTYTFDRERRMRIAVAIHIANPTGCTVGNPCPEYDQSPEYVNAWVDWDGDKSFDADERVMNQAGTGYININYSGTMSFVAQVQVPKDAASVIYLRVNLGWGQDPDNPHEYAWTWGDVQDYKIDFTAWRQGIRPGDILAHRHFGPIALSGWWTHVGVYIGNGQLIEAVQTGVETSPIENWDYPKDIDVQILRVNGNYDVSDVIEFLGDQVDKPYDYNYFGKQSNSDAESWYCSELAWAAYFNEGIDIEDSPDSIVVTPTEISDDNDTEQIDGHGRMADGTVLPQDTEDDSLTVEAHSPVDIEIIDPDGNTFSKATAPQSSDFTYAEIDIDQDGDNEDLLIVHHRKVGDYAIRVVPEEDALPSDTYTLTISAYGVPTTVADNVSIAETPIGFYIVTSGDKWIVLPPPANNPPEANAGEDQRIAWAGSPISVSLNANQSHDPDGDALVYVWAGPFVEGNGVASGMNPTVTFASPGIYSVNLGVDDGHGEWDMDSVMIMITIPGDSNGDGKVDCVDLAIVKASFGKRSGQSGFDARADMNNDDIVDVRDLAFVSRKLPIGTKCQ